MKKGFIDAQTASLLSITLGLIFFVLVYAWVNTDLGPKTIDAYNTYIGQKIGIVINPGEVKSLAPEGTLLNAKITSQPESLVCKNEPVYFSANSTSLPDNLTIRDAGCYWDFDIASEPCTGSEPPSGIDCTPGSPSNNSITTDDYQAITCDTNSSGPWPSSDVTVGGEKQGVQLLVVAGGKTATNILLVKSTLMCACAGVSPGCSDAPSTNLKLPANLANHQALNVGFKGSWSPAAINIIVEPVGNVSNLIVGIGPDTGWKMTGNLTSPTIVYGQNLLHLIEQQRSNCAHSGADPCIVPLSFDFTGKKDSSIIIKEIWIPLNVALI